MAFASSTSYIFVAFEKDRRNALALSDDNPIFRSSITLNREAGMLADGLRPVIEVVSLFKAIAEGIQVLNASKDPQVEKQGKSLQVELQETVGTYKGLDTARVELNKEYQGLMAEQNSSVDNIFEKLKKAPPHTHRKLLESPEISTELAKRSSKLAVLGKKITATRSQISGMKNTLENFYKKLKPHYSSPQVENLLSRKTAR